MAISKDFLESDLPNPELSLEEDDFPEEFVWLELGSSCFGGASFLMFTTLSTIWVPIKTGFTSSLGMEYFRLFTITGLPLFWELPLETRPLKGEHAFCLDLPLELVSTEDGRALGLSLDAELGLADDDVNGRDFTVGELPRDGTGFLIVVSVDFVTEEGRPMGADVVGILDELDGRRVGVAVLGVDLEPASIESLPVGVEERALDGVEDLLGGAVTLLDGTVALDVGVEDLKGFDIAGNVGRPVGVAGLEAADPAPPDDEGLLMPALEDLTPTDEAARLADFSSLLEAGSTGGSASLDLGAVIWEFEFPLAFITLFSNEGNIGVQGGVRSQS